MNTGTFNADNIPPEWQEIFDKLNLSEEDYKDKEVMNLIVQETIMQQVKDQAIKTNNYDLQKKIKEAEEE